MRNVKCKKCIYDTDCDYEDACQCMKFEGFMSFERDKHLILEEIDEAYQFEKDEHIERYARTNLWIRSTHR